MSAFPELDDDNSGSVSVASRSAFPELDDNSPSVFGNQNVSPWHAAEENNQPDLSVVPPPPKSSEVDDLARIPEQRVPIGSDVGNQIRRDLSGDAGLSTPGTVGRYTSLFSRGVRRGVADLADNLSDLGVTDSREYQPETPLNPATGVAENLASGGGRMLPSLPAFLGGGAAAKALTGVEGAATSGLGMLLGGAATSPEGRTPEGALVNYGFGVTQAPAAAAGSLFARRAADAGVNQTAAGLLGRGVAGIGAGAPAAALAAASGASPDQIASDALLNAGMGAMHGAEEKPAVREEAMAPPARTEAVAFPELEDAPAEGTPPRPPGEPVSLHPTSDEITPLAPWERGIMESEKRFAQERMIADSLAKPATNDNAFSYPADNSAQPNVPGENVSRETMGGEAETRPRMAFPELEDAPAPSAADELSAADTVPIDPASALHGAADTIEREMRARPALSKYEATAGEGGGGEPGDAEPIKILSPTQKLIHRSLGAMENAFGKTLPITTRFDRASGELGARMISSKQAAEPMAHVIATEVLGGAVDPVKFGAALTEDNLRDVHKGHVDAGRDELANRVSTIIGAPKSPFKTEAEYQSFLRDPETQAALARHRELWDSTVEPLWRKQHMLAEDAPTETRGLETGARINLFHNPEGASPSVVSGTRRGDLTNTYRRKSAFDRMAKGSGDSYNLDYGEIMRNTLNKRLERANKVAFDQRLVKSENAVIGKFHQSPTLPDGEGTVKFPLGPEAAHQNIYVRHSLEGEYRRAAEVDKHSTPGILRAVNSVINKTALAGFTEGVSHSINLLDAALRSPGALGRLHVDTAIAAVAHPVHVSAVLGKIVKRAFKMNEGQMRQIAELAEIGASRQAHQWTETKNPLSMLSQGMGHVLQRVDRATRTVMDDAFKNLLKDGLVPDTETARREFVNQAGQYNLRAQGAFKSFLRQSGLSPFATAGTNFLGLAYKNALLSPGTKATSLPAATAMRVGVLSRWVGATVFAGVTNYYLTHDKGGGVMGRPGIPFGNIDLGTNDKAGNPQSIPYFGIVGLDRALRAIGARGVINSLQRGLPVGTAVESGTRDVINSWISPWAGPAVQLGFGVAYGKRPSIGAPAVARRVAPGENQFVENAKDSAIELNPIARTVAASFDPNKTVGDVVSTQAPRLALQSSHSASYMAKYPEIVDKAQARGFVEDLIGAARPMAPAAQQQFVREELNRLSPEDREHAKRTLKYSRIRF